MEAAQDLALNIDYVPVWTWILAFLRFLGLFSFLPGIGTQQVPAKVKTLVAISFSVVVVLAGVRADIPQHMPEGGLMILTELLVGAAIGMMAAMIIGGVAVGGQVATGAMGLGQASMIDPSLGINVSVLARVQMLLATAVFLMIDGHHSLIKVSSGVVGDIGIGGFRPTSGTAMMLVDRFSAAFELAVIVAAPILVTLLVTQFVLGLITRFVPQVNIFIISLPLTIMLGLFITAYCLPGLADHTADEFRSLDEYAAALLIKAAP